MLKKVLTNIIFLKKIMYILNLKLVTFFNKINNIKNYYLIFIINRMT